MYYKVTTLLRDVMRAGDVTKRSKYSMVTLWANARIF